MYCDDAISIPTVPVGKSPTDRKQGDRTTTTALRAVVQPFQSFGGAAQQHLYKGFVLFTGVRLGWYLGLGWGLDVI